MLVVGRVALEERGCIIVADGCVCWALGNSDADGRERHGELANKPHDGWGQRMEIPGLSRALNGLFRI